MDEHDYPRRKIFKRRHKKPERNSTNDHETHNANAFSFVSLQSENREEPATTTRATTVTEAASTKDYDELFDQDTDSPEKTSQELLAIIMQSDGILSLDKDSIIDNEEEEHEKKEALLSQSSSVSSLPHRVAPPLTASTSSFSSSSSASSQAQQERLQPRKKASKISIVMLLTTTFAIITLANYYYVGYMQVPVVWSTMKEMTNTSWYHLSQDWMKQCHGTVKGRIPYVRQYGEKAILLMDDMVTEAVALWWDWRYRLALWILPPSSSFPSSLCDCRAS